MISVFQNIQQLEKPALLKVKTGVKTGVKAGADPQGYCLQGCVTAVNQCYQQGLPNCDMVSAECYNSCVTPPPAMLT